jgi:ribosomal protein S1
VLNVDRQNRRISLGYKQTKENPWDNFENVYKPGTISKGKIVRLIEKGVIVELPEAVDGFVPISHLQKTNLSKPSDGYKVGDDLELCVIEFNKVAKKIVLSEKIDYALSLIRQKEQGKKVQIEEADEIFAETTPEVQMSDQVVAETAMASITVEDELTTKNEGTQVETKAEPAAIAEAVSEIQEQETVEASAETMVEAIAPPAEVTEADTVREQAAPDIGGEKEAAVTRVKKSKAGVRAKKTPSDTDAEPVETAAEEAAMKEDKASDAPEKASSKKRPRKKKEAEDSAKAD